MGLSNKIKIYFPVLFCAISLTAFSQSSNFKVALDAGHGGKDFGAVYNGHIEKNIALGVTLKVGKILEDISGVEVLYTRKTDVFIELIERANIANRADANIFVSIHCNANKNAAASGTESYVMGLTKSASNLEAARRENSVITLEKDYKEKYQGYNPNDPESEISIEVVTDAYLENSIELAGKVQDQFTDKLGKKSRGVKQAPYMVLHKAYMPRILIEMGFISNPEDGAFLDSEEGQQQIARAIADAVISYKKEYYGSGVADDVKPSDRVPKQAPVPTPDPDTVVTKPITKTPVTTPPVKQPDPKPEAPATVGNVIFKVQLAVSSTKLELTPANFNGLGTLSMIMAGNMYKYMYGQTGDYSEAKKLQGEAKSKGYSSAFVVAFQDGKKITVDEALKALNKR
jgi:N-acetylmuramoyl-L-alanine amidase